MLLARRESNRRTRKIKRSLAGAAANPGFTFPIFLIFL
jgi:hypothetical protein